MADVYTWAPNIPSVNRPAIRLYPEINSHLCLYTFVKYLFWVICAVFVFIRSNRFDTIVYSGRYVSALLVGHFCSLFRTRVFNTGSYLGHPRLFRRCFAFIFNRLHFVLHSEHSVVHWFRFQSSFEARFGQNSARDFVLRLASRLSIIVTISAFLMLSSWLPFLSSHQVTIGTSSTLFSVIFPAFVDPIWPFFVYKSLIFSGFYNVIFSTTITGPMC